MGLPCDRSRLDPREEARRVSAFSLVHQEIPKPRKISIVNRLPKKEDELAIGVDGRDWRTVRLEFMGPTVAFEAQQESPQIKGRESRRRGGFPRFACMADLSIFMHPGASSRSCGLHITVQLTLSPRATTPRRLSMLADFFPDEPQKGPVDTSIAKVCSRLVGFCLVEDE